MKIIEDGKAYRPIKFDRWTYKSNYSTCPRKNVADYPQMLLGHFREDYMRECMKNDDTPSRNNSNVIPDYFLFECDSLDLEGQIELINNLDWCWQKFIKCVTFSGNKSLHVLFSICGVPDDITNDEYKRLWKKFMSLARSGEHRLIEYADPQVATLSHMARNPNGIRENGTRQTCLYFTNDNEEFNVQPMLDGYNGIREEIALEGIERDMRYASMRNRSDDNRSIDEILSSLSEDSKSRRYYEQILANDFPSGVNYLSMAQTLYTFLEKKGHGADGILWIRESLLIPVSEAHKTNISPNRAKNWEPLR